MTAPAKKLITMPQLQDALGDRLPFRPEYKKMIRALEEGMPRVVSPMLGGSHRMRYLFDLDAVLAWWFPEGTTPPRADRTAVNAALQIRPRQRRKKAG